MLLTNHRIKESHLELLCRGHGSPEVTRELWQSEFSRRLLIFDSVVRLLTDRPELLGPLPAMSTTFDLLSEIDEVDRETVRAVLLHPQVGSWAAYLLRRSLGLVRPAAPWWVDAGVVHAVAFAAAVRHGRDWTTAVPARRGRAMLPGLGMAVFPADQGWGPVEAAFRGGEMTLRCGKHEVRVADAGVRTSPAAEWWPLRRLRFGADPVLAVMLDDIDPFRDLGDPVEPERLTDADVARWESLLDGAWSILCTGHRGSALAMASGVVSVVPLAEDGDETRSASTGEAFGEVLVSEPDDAMSLAVALVHEFAHIQLGGLLHLLPVTSGGEQEAFYAPWRDDPRPLPGLVQGIYAFTGIADFWRTQVLADPDDYREFEYLCARLQAEEALRVASGSGALTPVGERLVAGLTDRLSQWQGDPVSAVAESAARTVTACHRAGWRIRHLRPSRTTVDLLATAWTRGDPPPSSDPGYRVVPSRARWSQGRLALTRRWMRRGDAEVTPRLRAYRVDDADTALLRGETAAAAAGFTRRITDDPADLDAWSGLGVALDGPARWALTEHPALVRAVHSAVPEPAADPMVLAAWLGSWRTG